MMAFKRALVLFSAVMMVCTSQTSGSRIDAFHLVKDGLKDYLLFGKTSELFLQAMKIYQLPHVFRDDSAIRYDDKESCEMCHTFADLAIAAHWAGVTKERFKQRAIFLCNSMKIETEAVCQGILDMNLDTYLYILENQRGNLTSDRICGVFMQKHGCKYVPSNWSITIPSGTSRPRAGSKNPEDTFNILHISDMHYDPRYTPGRNNHCDEPLCCQDDSGAPDKKKHTCGYWTDYKASDVPWHLVEESVLQTQAHKYDYVYYTGDIISHRTWGTSLTNNTRDIAKLYEFFKKNYNVPVFPVFGNHEPHPVNQWSSEGVNSSQLTIKWLYELAAEHWSNLMGDVSAKSTILRGGYYSVSPRKGFRVIGINSNFCYTSNFWLVFDDKDPMGQLQWLVEELTKAENNDESVHIITHVPTGVDNCLKRWSHEYNRIVERFSHTITGQFNGHTHRDDMHIYYSTTNFVQPVGVAFNGASITPYSNSNPSFKIYQVVKDTYTLQNFEEWTFNLTLANEKPMNRPKWYKLYNFRDTYDTRNLSATEIDRVAHQMAKHHKLIDTYVRLNYRDGDAGLSKDCNAACRKDYLCDIVTTDSSNQAQCDYFKRLYDQ